MTKRSVKFRKNRHKEGKEELRTQGTYYFRGTEGGNAEYYLPPLYFEKAVANNGNENKANFLKFPNFYKVGPFLILFLEKMHTTL